MFSFLAISYHSHRFSQPDLVCGCLSTRPVRPWVDAAVVCYLTHLPLISADPWLAGEEVRKGVTTQVTLFVLCALNNHIGDRSR